MSSLLLANCTPSTNRVALVQENKLKEIHLEHSSDRTLVGSIMKGRVTNIVPGMQCAFVDVGIQKDLFLPLSDINIGEPWQVDDEDDGEESQPPVSITDVLKVGQEILVQIIKEQLLIYVVFVMVEIQVVVQCLYFFQSMLKVLLIISI